MRKECTAKIHELSQLCRIKLTPEEEQMLEKNIRNILTYVDQIEEVDTEGMPICTTVLPTTNNVFGEDVCADPYDREDFLANSPDQVGGMIKIFPVFEDEV